MTDRAKSDGRFRPAIFAVLLAAFLAIAALRVFGALDAYDAILTAWGVVVKFPAYIPYLDTNVVLSALQCHRQGLDVIEANPCDVLGRVHIYSPLWLALAPTGLGAADTPWVGTLMDVGFLAVAAWVTTARNAGEATVFLLALLSQSFALALDRANFDLLIFILVVAGCALFARGPAGRLAAYVIIYASAALKFYPIVVFGLALTERLGRFAAVAAVAAIAWALFFYASWSDLARILTHIPRAQPLQDAFGGVNFFQALGHLAIRYRPRDAAAIMAVATASYYAAALGVVVVSFGLARRLIGAGAAIPAGGLTGILFLAGALITIFAFFTAQSPPYRAIWLLLLLPLLTGLRRGSGGWLRRLWGGEIALMIGLLWFEFIHVWTFRLTGSHDAEDLVTFLVREPLWWIFIIGVMTLFWAQLASTPTVGRLPIWPRRALADGRPM